MHTHIHIKRQYRPTYTGWSITVSSITGLYRLVYNRLGIRSKMNSTRILVSSGE